MNKSCSTPEAVTDQARVWPMSQPNRTAATIARTRKTFITTGATAVARKCPIAFRTPDSRAVSEMKRI